MQSINITAYTDPSGYQLTSLPKPQVTDELDVVIRVHASSINPIDVRKASGEAKAIIESKFPYKIGYDAAGVITAIGSSVKAFQVGDEVYTRLPESHMGAWSEYVKAPENYVSHKPHSLSFEEAASVPLVAMTALQGLQRYRGSLAGKTVFIPAALSGTGSYACQLAKNVFHAGKVITTVSTSKVPLVSKLLGEGVVDQVIDYTMSDAKSVIPDKSVDFLFDTTGQAMEFLNLMVPQSGLIVSIATSPSATQMKDPELVKSADTGNVPFVIGTVLNTIDYIRKFRAKRWNTSYEFLFLNPSRKDLDQVTAYIEAKKVKPIIEQEIDFEDLEKIRKACIMSMKGKGITGKTVIKMKV